MWYNVLNLISWQSSKCKLTFLKTKVNRSRTSLWCTLPLFHFRRRFQACRSPLSILKNHNHSLLGLECQRLSLWLKGGLYRWLCTLCQTQCSHAISLPVPFWLLLFYHFSLRDILFSWSQLQSLPRGHELMYGTHSAVRSPAKGPTDYH